MFDIKFPAGFFCIVAPFYDIFACFIETFTSGIVARSISIVGHKPGVRGLRRLINPVLCNFFHIQSSVAEEVV